MFALDDARQQLRIEALQLLIHAHASFRRSRKTLQVLLAALGPERRGQHPLGEIDAALSHVQRPGGRVAKFLEHRLGLLRRNRRQIRDRGAHALHFLIAQMPQDFGGRLVAERDQKNRGFLNSCDCRGHRCGRHRLPALPQPAAQNARANSCIFLRGGAKLIGQRLNSARRQRRNGCAPCDRSCGGGRE